MFISSEIVHESVWRVKKRICEPFVCMSGNKIVCYPPTFHVTFVVLLSVFCIHAFLIQMSSALEKRIVFINFF